MHEKQAKPSKQKKKSKNLKTNKIARNAIDPCQIFFYDYYSRRGFFLLKFSNKRRIKIDYSYHTAELETKIVTVDLTVLT